MGKGWRAPLGADAQPCPPKRVDIILLSARQRGPQWNYTFPRQNPLALTLSATPQHEVELPGGVLWGGVTRAPAGSTQQETVHFEQAAPGTGAATAVTRSGAGVHRGKEQLPMWGEIRVCKAPWQHRAGPPLHCLLEAQTSVCRTLPLGVD